MQKSDIIAHFVWAIMSGPFCPWAILSGNRDGGITERGQSGLDLRFCPTLCNTPTMATVYKVASFRAATNESQKTRNKNQETKRFSTFTVSHLRHSETKKNIA